MSDLAEPLTGLLTRVPGLRSVFLLDARGSLAGHADRGGLVDLPLLALSCHRLARETLGTALRLQQGPVGQIVLEAERVTLLLLPAEDGRTLCLLLDPEAAAGQALFEARKLFALLTEGT
jgi:predicted regulator of Ras-like GTPase activity (Roadblock/LC7/MglB family)